MFNYPEGIFVQMFNYPEGISVHIKIVCVCVMPNGLIPSVTYTGPVSGCVLEAVKEVCNVM